MTDSMPVSSQLSFLLLDSTLLRTLSLIEPSTKPHFIHDALIEWVESVEQTLDELTAKELSAFGPDWSCISNLRFAFQAKARHLANAVRPPGPATDALNRFINSKPFVLRTGYFPHYWYTIDLFSSRINSLAKDLKHLPMQDETSMLIVKPDHGLLACWLMDNVLTSPNSIMDIIGPPLPVTYERAIFDQNIHLSQAKNKRINLGITEGSSLEGLQNREKPRGYDFIYFEGFRNLKDRQTPLSLAELLILAWRHLKRGGLLTIDDQLITENPIDSGLWPATYAIATDSFLRILQGAFSTVSRGRHITIKKKY